MGTEFVKDSRGNSRGACDDVDKHSIDSARKVGSIVVVIAIICLQSGGGYMAAAGNGCCGHSLYGGTRALGL